MKTVNQRLFPFEKISLGIWKCLNPKYFSPQTNILNVPVYHYCLRYVAKNSCCEPVHHWLITKWCHHNLKLVHSTCSPVKSVIFQTFSRPKGTVLIVANNFIFLGEYTIQILCGKDEVGEGPYYVNVYNPKSVIINNMPFHCFVGEKCTFLGLNNYLVQKLCAF